MGPSANTYPAQRCRRCLPTTRCSAASPTTSWPARRGAALRARSRLALGRARRREAEAAVHGGRPWAVDTDEILLAPLEGATTDLADGAGRRGHGLEKYFSTCRTFPCYDTAESVDDHRVELRSRAPAQLLDGLGVADALAVGALAGHRVEGVADRHNAGAERNLVAAEAVRVAAAV